MYTPNPTTLGKASNQPRHRLTSHKDIKLVLEKDKEHQNNIKLDQGDNVGTFRKPPGQPSFYAVCKRDKTHKLSDEKPINIYEHTN